jgi:hypothetical protein
MNIADQLEAHAHEELKHAITIARQIDYLGKMPAVVPKPVRTSEKAKEMLRYDLDTKIRQSGTTARGSDNANSSVSLPSPNRFVRSLSKNKILKLISRPPWAKIRRIFRIDQSKPRRCLDRGDGLQSRCGKHSQPSGNSGRNLT